MGQVTAHKRKNGSFQIVRKIAPNKEVQQLSFYEKHFWILAACVVLISIFIRAFDFSLTPPSYNGLFIKRPYCGLHGWHFSSQAWAARSHIKYGLGYTKGYPTLVVGDNPHSYPLRYVSHPSLNNLIMAFGMLLFGTEDWGVRLFDIFLSIRNEQKSKRRHFLELASHSEFFFRLGKLQQCFTLRCYVSRCQISCYCGLAERYAAVVRRDLAMEQDGKAVFS